MHKEDSSEDYLGAFTGIGSRNKLPLVQLKNSWEFGSAYTGVRIPLVQPRDSEENLGHILRSG